MEHKVEEMTTFVSIVKLNSLWGQYLFDPVDIVERGLSDGVHLAVARDHEHDGYQLVQVELDELLVSVRRH